MGSAQIGGEYNLILSLSMLSGIFINVCNQIDGFALNSIFDNWYLIRNSERVI